VRDRLERACPMMPEDSLLGILTQNLTSAFHSIEAWHVQVKNDLDLKGKG